MTAAITLFTDYGCPYSQRIEAVLVLHGAAYERRLVEANNKPAELLRHSPTARIPLAVVGSSALYEGVVIADYLADLLDWQQAYPAQPEGRALHRLAIRRLGEMWQASALELAGTALSAKVLSRIDEDLDMLERTIERYPANEPCMLVFAAVPFWLRWQWMGDGTVMGERVGRRSTLRAWLTQGESLAALRATTPDEERTRNTHASVA